MIRRLGLIFSVICLLGLTACAGRDFTYAGDEGLAISAADSADLGYSTRWVQSLVLGEGQRIGLVKALDDEIIVIERPENIVSSIAMADGELRWKKVVGGGDENIVGAASAGERVYLNTARTIFTLNQNSGRVENTAALDQHVASSPVIDQGVERDVGIFGGVEGTLFAHRLDEGYAMWRYSLPSPILLTPLLTDNNVFAVDRDGHYVMLTADSRELLWRNSTFAGVSARPAIDRNFIILASEDQSLYSINAATGQDRWPPFRSAVPLTNPPVVLGDAILQIQRGIGLTAIDSDSGQERWTRRPVLRPVALKDEAIVAHGNQSLHLLDSQSGEAIRSKSTAPLYSVIAGPENSLVLVSRAGQLLRIDPR